MIKRSIQTPTLHRVVENNGTLYIAGTTATDKKVAMRGQTEQILAKFDEMLAAVGSDKSKLLAVTIFITDFEQKPEMDVAWNAWTSPDILPTRATIGVANLGPGCLIEMTAIAAK